MKTINNITTYDELTRALDDANRDLFFAKNGSGKLPNLSSPKVYIDNKPIHLEIDYTSDCIRLSGAVNQ